MLEIIITFIIVALCFWALLLVRRWQLRVRFQRYDREQFHWSQNDQNLAAALREMERLNSELTKVRTRNTLLETEHAARHSRERDEDEAYKRKLEAQIVELNSRIAVMQIKLYGEDTRPLDVIE